MCFVQNARADLLVTHRAALRCPSTYYRLHHHLVECFHCSPSLLCCVLIVIAGGFKTQEEFGGQQSRVDITPAEAALVMRVLEASAAAVQRSKAAALAGAAAAGAASMPVEVVRPGDLFPIARVDFLRAPPALRSEAFGSDAASVGDDGGADLLLLELEVIEPCLFFGVDALGQGGPGTANAAAAAAVLGAGADAAAAAAPATSKSAEALADAIAARLTA